MSKVQVQQSWTWHEQAQLARVKRQLAHEAETRQYNDVLDTNVEEFMTDRHFIKDRKAIANAIYIHLTDLWNIENEDELIQAVARKLYDAYAISVTIQEMAATFDRYETDDSFQTSIDTMEMYLSLEEAGLLNVRIKDYEEMSSIYIDSNLKLSREDMKIMNAQIDNSPMFCPPIDWKYDDDKQKYQGGYFRNDTNLLLGNHKLHHSYKVNPQATNLLQKIEWHVDYDVVNALESLGIKPEKEIRTNLKMFLGLVETRPVWFTWGMDLRGRSYVRAWGLNPNGSQYQKGIMTFGKEKIISDKSIRRLKVDIAGRLGMDKLTTSDRLAWFMDNVEPTLDGVKTLAGAVRRKAFKDLIAKAIENEEAYAVAVRQIGEYLKARDGKPCRAKTYRDATSNGIQLLSTMTNDARGMMSSNVIPNPKNKRMNAYQVGATNMSLRADKFITAKEFKAPGMTMLYGSQKEPEKAFGSDVKFFYQAMDEEFEGAVDALNEITDSWQPYAEYHTWTMPNGRTCHIGNLEKEEENIIFDIDGKVKIEFVKYVLEGKKNGVSLAANITHAVDSWFKDQIIIYMWETHGVEVHSNHDEFVCDIEWDDELLEAAINAMDKIYNFEDDQERRLLESILYEISGKEIDLQIDNKDRTKMIHNSEYIIC